jgi:integrase
MTPQDAFEERFLQHFTEDDLAKISSTNIQTDLRCELDRIVALCDRGLWADVPQLAQRKWSQHYTPDVKGEDTRPKKETKREKRQPLPDEYVAEGGWRVLWIAQELGPNLLTVARQIADVIAADPIEGADVLADSVGSRRRLKFKQLIAEHKWVDSKGGLMDAPPFSLAANVWGGAALEAGEWPPTTAAHILGLLQLLQMSHLWIALLSVGSRISEMLSFRPNSIVHSSDGTPFANGLTFKLVDRIGGGERDWPLPDVALNAIRQQEELCELIHRLGYLSGDPEPATASGIAAENTIWARIGSRTEFSSDVNERLRLMSVCLGLTDKPGGKNLTTHRFRKTVARLAALALSGAPKILMDLFGHRSIEMTLQYILSDPDIQAEIKQVVEDVAVMRARDAIESIDSYGGPAAKRIAGMLSQERARLGRDLGAADMRQLAEVLTLSGQSWALVRPGVICTKLPGSAGPCTKKVGRPEPSRCRWGCDHRLEEAYLRDDVDRSIAEAVKLYELEVIDDNEMGQEFWAGQILAHLRRFEDIEQKWTVHPTVAQVLLGAAASAS